MRHRLPRAAPFLFLVAFLWPGRGALAQDTTAIRRWAEANKNFGMDAATFRRVFRSVFASQQPAARVSTTVEELADQVTDLRLFATGANVAVGEVVIAGRTRLQEMTLQLEQGAVTFNDRGQAPDRKAGDGVFTARFRMNTDAEWQATKAALNASVQALTDTTRRFVRRGPRDLVPLRQVLDSLRVSDTAGFRALSEPRTRELATARTVADAARIGRINLETTPMISVPLPPLPPIPPIPRPGQFDRFKFRRAFEIPTLELFPFPFPIPPAIDVSRSLMIRHKDVVEDAGRTFDVCGGTGGTAIGTAGGVWTFGHLMREMAFGTGMSPEDFTMHWLSTWIIPQEANGFIVNEASRGVQLQSRIIATWQALSGGTLNVDQFPARLLAIVNRPDLADKIGYGVAGSAGEGRFVFGLLQKDVLGNCIPLPFTVIFEYGIVGGSCNAVKAWEQRWKNLDAFALGSAPYNAALEAITKDFTEHGTNPSQHPNQSSLNQLRTNEIALGSPWQLREFRLQSNGAVPPGTLDLVTVKQTPDDGFNNGAVLSAYILGNETAIAEKRHVVPERFPGILDPFLGAKSNADPGMFWNAPGLMSPPMMKDPVQVRRLFSLSTCNGCHTGETQTGFTHVSTRNAGTEAALSGFLTGEDVTVPVSGGLQQHYADLDDERVPAMQRILTTSCFGLLGVRRIPFVH